jgi:hypothetical protein
MKYLGREIAVATRPGKTEPAAFDLGGERHVVVEIRRQWFDAGHGATPLAARSWRTRHHRKHFVVATDRGAVFHLYYDYADRARPAWVLVTKEDEAS